jgi:hypothetical protein
LIWIVLLPLISFHLLSADDIGRFFFHTGRLCNAVFFGCFLLFVGVLLCRMWSILFWSIVLSLGLHCLACCKNV